jgi:hypothetical protein
MRVSFHLPSLSILYDVVSYPLKPLFLIVKKALDFIARIFTSEPPPKTRFQYRYISDNSSHLISSIASLIKPSIDKESAITDLISAINSLPDYDDRYYSLCNLATLFEKQNLTQRALDTWELAGTEYDFILAHARISDAFDLAPIDRADNLLCTKYTQTGSHVLMDIIESTHDSEMKFFYLYLLLTLWAIHSDKIEDQEMEPFLEKIENAIEALPDPEYEESLRWILQHLSFKRDFIK